LQLPNWGIDIGPPHFVRSGCIQPPATMFSPCNSLAACVRPAVKCGICGSILHRLRDVSKHLSFGDLRKDVEMDVGVI
jgi:hypothetical protein